VAVAVAAAAWLAAAAPAGAHARLVRSDPPYSCGGPGPLAALPESALCGAGAVLRRMPSTVRLWFNEPVAPAGRGVRVFGPDGRRVDAGPVEAAGARVSVLIRGGTPGTYLVVWRVIAADTHPAEGAFPFSLLRPSRPALGVPDADTGRRSAIGLALQALGRAVHFAGFALSAGVFAFRQCVLAPRAPSGDSAVEQRVFRLIDVGIIALLAAEPLALAAQSLSLSAAGEPPFDPDLLGASLDSSFGRVAAQRAGGALALWVLAGAARGRHAGGGAATLGVIACASGLALVDGEAAHAPGGHPLWLAFAANGAHVLGMALWAGTLAGVLVVHRQPSLAPRRREVLRAAGGMAGGGLVLLALAGAVMAVQHLTAARDLAATPYGRVLAAKVCLAAAALGCAGAAARAPLARRGIWWRREAAALLLVLALAGLLVSLPPPV
jgi:copper transport protein